MRLTCVLGPVAPRYRKSLADGLRAAAQADCEEAARAAFDKLLLTGVGERYPKVVALWEEALARSGTVARLSEPMQSLVRSADRTAAEVSGRLAREIKRHGHFDDPDAALDFVSGALLRAERRLDRARDEALAVRDDASLATRGGRSKSTDAVGVPTLA
jgi:transposase-like protein